MALGSLESADATPAPFLNRGKELGVIQSHIASLLKNPEHFAVFEVSGIAGAGKSSLLKELRAYALEETRLPHVLWVSLEGEASNTAVGPLRLLRKQIGVDCLLFDAALRTYLNSTGQIYVETGGGYGQSLASKAIEVGGRFAPVPLPVGLGAELLRRFNRGLEKRHHYRQEEFDEIEALSFDPAVLHRRLPHYLAVDIMRRLDSREDSLVVFYESYENQGPETLSEQAPWLRRLIKELGRGVHVIANRGPLSWPAEVWQGIVHPVPVDELPEAESRQLLRTALGRLPPEAEERLLKASRGIPMRLQMAVRGYGTGSGEGAVKSVDELPSTPDAMLAFSLQHLTRPRRRAAIALAAVQVFDDRLYKHLIRALNLLVEVFDQAEVRSSLFVEEISEGLYKAHDSITDYARESKSESDVEVREAGLNAATEDLILRCEDGGLKEPDAVLPLFRSLLAGWSSVNAMSTESAERLVDAAYLLYDGGFWHELASMPVDDMLAPDHPVAVTIALFAALATRRTVGVGQARALLDRLSSRVEKLGRHARSVEIEIAYITELSGDYRTARWQFRALYERTGTSLPDKHDRSQLRAHLYHADMLIMDGELEEASRILLAAYGRIDRHGNLLDSVELIRHRALAHRHAFVLDVAANLYNEARREAATVPALVAKLDTNLVEVYCWHEPELALETAALAREQNARLGNKIELAKCSVVSAIALAKLDRFDDAGAMASKAVAEAEDVGYPAGRVFALQAKAVISALAGDRDGALAGISELKQAANELDTYRHLSVAPEWLMRDSAPFDKPTAGIGWITPEQIEDRLQMYIGG
jgi:hypothetical protein